jgi:clan AA aspartic protease (TIGR02281 family)
MALMMCSWSGWAVTLQQEGAHLTVDGVLINGRGPFRFLLDTGAESTVVSPAVAAQVGLTPTYRVAVVTVNGTLEAVGTKVPRLSVGEVRVDGVEVLWYPLDGLRGVGKDVVGILGQNTLRAMAVYTIDAGQGTLTAGRGEFANSGERFRMEWVAGRPVVALDGMRLVLDSGAPALILFRDRFTGYRQSGVAQLGNSTGAVRTVGMGRLRRFWRWQNVAASLVGERPGVEVDGLLPVSLFESVTVDADGGWVTLRLRAGQSAGTARGLARK